MADHICAHPVCTDPIPIRHFACREHWYELPKRLRMGLERAWRNLELARTDDNEANDEYRRFVLMAVTYWRNKAGVKARKP